MPLPIDLRPVEACRRRSGYFLKCPRCCRWVKTLLIVGDGQLLCASCRDADGEAGM
jgi:hypothetical protein